ncbi:hypothetical protein [Bythopirellula polymerisocia]|uniref:EamA-like transporter family protein n=1 Tax=Bythopirellula polymerisocia TaxID=2528003 RepID=A0A5C6CED1_9BACT|nr:hypothetical protein [Bythopirellula polymerisocia]TWU21791.1 EamA-like transporter family protein [Bythopirellula polymerisocia]
MKPSAQAYLVLALGVLSVSTGAIFVRFAQQEAASLTIAEYRLGIGFVVMLIPTLVFRRRELLISHVSRCGTGEPIFSTILAYLLFDEALSIVQIGGCIIILIGIYLAARAANLDAAIVRSFGR